MTLIQVPTADSLDFAANLLRSHGADFAEAEPVVRGLIDADLAGISSHGLGLLPMYLERIRLGSVRVGQGEPPVLRNTPTTAVVDGEHRLGQPVADFAMGLAIDKAKNFGSGIVAVRHGFHFGAATRYVSQAADQGCVGIAMCNTRPLMPAPGGAERLVGNNPIAIAVPSNGDRPLVLDLALSEVAMGKIRRAKDLGQDIPPTWATTSSGEVTTDPGQAIEGMLLPIGGHKGFGLAFMVDVLVGGLSGGAWGEKVSPLYSDLDQPYDCSQLFMAIDTEHFGVFEEFLGTSTMAADRVRASKSVDGERALMTPGEPEWKQRTSNPGEIEISAIAADQLVSIARESGVQVPDAFVLDESTDEHKESIKNA